MEEGAAAYAGKQLPVSCAKTQVKDGKLDGAVVISDNIHSWLNLSWHMVLTGKERQRPDPRAPGPGLGARASFPSR